jgi:hypothetical protein
MARRSQPRFEYTFPLDSITLRNCQVGGYVEAEIIQLTRMLAWWRIDGSWHRFRGPFVEPCEEPEDHHWRWVSFVRRLRKIPLVRCAAAQTPDGHIQGAIIYRGDGGSWLAPGDGSVYVEYLATALRNRPDYAREPLYRGIGEGLITLAMLQSYQWGKGGRVTLRSLPRAASFYKKMHFVETASPVDRMIAYEVRPEVAGAYLVSKGLIDGRPESTA